MNGKFKFAMLALAAMGIASPALASGDAAHGAVVFKRCTICHSLDPAKKMMGPALNGLMGRQVGSVAGFNYSADMKGAKQKWDAKLLDTYLTDPKSAFKSSRMAFKLANPKDRTDLIAYLATNPKP